MRVTHIYQYRVMEWFHPCLPCLAVTHTHTQHTHTLGRTHTRRRSNTFMQTHSHTLTHMHPHTFTLKLVHSSHTSHTWRPGAQLRAECLTSCSWTREEGPAQVPSEMGAEGQGMWMGLCWELLARVLGVAQNDSETDRHSGEQWRW